MDYTIVSASDEKVFEKRCTETLAHGWTLVGGVAVAKDGKACLYAQAFTRPTKKE